MLVATRPVSAVSGRIHVLGICSYQGESTVSTRFTFFEGVPVNVSGFAVSILLLIALAGCASGPLEKPVSAVEQADASDSQDEDSDAQQAIASAVPDTDVFVFKINPDTPEIVQSFDANVTRRPGYDNQPSFLPGSNDFIFSSILDGRQSDVYVYRERSRSLKQLTRTEVSEYSPTPLADGGFSSVVVEADGTQRLWHYALSGSPQKPIRGDVTGVGYHAWLPGDQLALFIVDEPLMHLDVASVVDTTVYTLAVNPGRSLHRRPGTDSLSFVQHMEGEPSRLMSWDGARLEVLARMPEGVEDIAWLPDGRALTVADQTLLVWSADSPNWQAVIDLGEYLPGEVTRLAVNDAATRLAIVSNMAPQE